MATPSPRVYWAAEPDIKKLAPRCLERFSQHLGILKRSGRLEKMRASLSAYYGLGTDGMRRADQLQEAGEDGEAIDLHVNQIRPIVTNMLSLIAGIDPAVKPRARNTDAKTMAATRLALSLIETYDVRLSSKEREIDTVRGGLIASSWSLGQAWMPKDGREWASDESGAPIYEGEIALFTMPPWRTVSDFAAQSEEQRKWVLFRRPVSRWDTAAQFDGPDATPEMREVARKLRKAPEAGMTLGPWGDATVDVAVATLDMLLGEKLPAEDVVWVWELRHLKTPALPQGRLVRFVEPDIVLWDSMKLGVEYPYKQLHLFEYAPERVVAGGQGHTAVFDLGALQEFIDIQTTAMATHSNILGQLHFWSATDDVQARALSTGNTLLTSPQEPKPVQWPLLPPLVLEAAQWAIEQARQAAALNNVVMGQPDKGMPASAQALQRAQAQQYHAVAQGERVRLRQRNTNGKLELLQRFARTPRMAELVGKSREYELKEWSSADIADVLPFDVEPVDPYSASYEGRDAMLERLITTRPDLFRDPDVMLTFMQTGSLAAVTETQTARRELVESNVALLRKGIGPPQVDLVASMQSGSPVFIEPPPGVEVLRILKSDPHHLAIPAYLGVIASPSSRADAALMKATVEAIQLSIQLWASLTPDEAAAFGLPPLPSQLAMAGMMGAPPPPEGEAPAPDEGGATDGMDAGPGGGVKLPAPPENPLNGQQEDSGATGLA